MIFKPNKYGYYLSIIDEAYILAEEATNDIALIDFNELDEPHNTGGAKALKDRIVNAVIALKNKALKAVGLDDGFSVSSCINKLKDMISSLIQRAKETIKTWTPKIRNFIDTCCDYIQDAIDYIKSEFE